MEIRKNLIIDVLALLVYAVVANPAWTGIALHEWLGIGIFVVFLVHCAVHYDWVKDAISSLRKKPTWMKTGNLVLDVITLIAFCVVTVSGLMVSATVLPALGFVSQGYFFWDPLHSTSAKLLLALILVHIVVHWRWFWNLFTHRNAKDSRTQTEAVEAPDAPAEVSEK